MNLRRFSIYRTLFSLLCIWIISGCSAPTEEQPNLRLNEISIAVTEQDSSVSNYSIKAYESSVFGSWVTDSLTNGLLMESETAIPSSVMLTIPGIAVGRYNWGTISWFNDLVIYMSMESFDYFSSEEGYTEITEFGAVGEYIRGRFSGTFSKRLELGGSLTKIEGTFNLVRLPDNKGIEN